MGNIFQNYCRQLCFNSLLQILIISKLPGPLWAKGQECKNQHNHLGGLSNIIGGGGHAHIVISTIGIIAELHILPQPRAMLNLKVCKNSPREVGWAEYTLGCLEENAFKSKHSSRDVLHKVKKTSRESVLRPRNCERVALQKRKCTF